MNNEQLNLLIHDIKSPWRHVKQFHDILLDASDEKASGELEEIQGYLTSAMATMDARLSVLLRTHQIIAQDASAPACDPSEWLRQWVDGINPGKVRLQLDIGDKAYCPFSELMLGELLELLLNALNTVLNIHQNSHTSLQINSLDDCLELYAKVEGTGVDESMHRQWLNTITRLHWDDTNPFDARLYLLTVIAGHFGGIVQLNHQTQSMNLEMCFSNQVTPNPTPSPN